MFQYAKTDYNIFTRKSICDFIRNFIQDDIRDSIHDSIPDFIRASIRDSLDANSKTQMCGVLSAISNENYEGVKSMPSKAKG